MSRPSALLSDEAVARLALAVTASPRKMGATGSSQLSLHVRVGVVDGFDDAAVRHVKDRARSTWNTQLLSLTFERTDGDGRVVADPCVDPAH